MSKKRKVQFAEEIKENEADGGPSSTRFKAKHSMDSDEEEDQPSNTLNEENILAEDDIEGLLYYWVKIHSHIQVNRHMCYV